MKPINWTIEQINALDQHTHKYMSDLANATEGNFNQADMDGIHDDGELNKATLAQKALMEKLHKACHDGEIIDVLNEMFEHFGLE